MPAMVKRLGALSALSLVTVAVTAPAVATADHAVGPEQAKRAVRATLTAEFRDGGGLKRDSLRVTCRRDGSLARCGIRMRDKRDRRWCGHSTVRPGHSGDGAPTTITTYQVRTARCGRA